MSNAQKSEQRRPWVFLVPVGNLVLTEAVGREFRIDRVTLVHKDKLPRIRKSLGLSASVSEVKKRIRGWDFFESAPAFAAVRHTSTSEEAASRCLELVREELSILTAAQLGYSKRGWMDPIALAGETGSSHIQYLGLSRDGTISGNRFRRTGGASNVGLDGRWKSYQDGVFFTKLLKILQGETQVTDSWRGELRRATVLIGESIGANDLLKSFVWNMVVLEMLLTRRQERLKETLPKRAEALLGWVGFWETDDYGNRIKQVYGKRNALLHSGRREDITEKDLVFTDALLLNLLINLVSHPKLFQSKDDVIKFSEKVEAERVLGVKPKVRPEGRGGLRFIGRP